MIHEVTGNLWEFHHLGHWIAIPTNGVIRKTGENVMGAGLAKQAAQRFPMFPAAVGDHLCEHGNIPFMWTEGRLIAIPTKSHFRDASSLDLVEASVVRTVALLDQYQIPVLYCPRLGCGLGQLGWTTVREALTPILDDRFMFVSLPDRW